MSEGEESSRFMVCMFLKIRGSDLSQYVCSHAYARTNHRIRQVSGSLQVSEIASIFLRRTSRFAEPIVGGHTTLSGLIYWKESSRLRAVCRKRLIILLAIVNL